MATVRGLRVSVRSDSGSDRSECDVESESDRDARESEPMEVEEGEVEADDIPVNRSLKELLPDTSRRYENKAGTFITGIDVNSKEAIERKERRARRFHFRPEVNLAQRDVVLDKDLMKKAIPKVRFEALHVTGVDDMSTQDVFGYFKEYAPAHIEWIDDTSCNVVWLDDVTSTRALINTSQMFDQDTVAMKSEEDSKQDGKASEQPRGDKTQGSDDEEEEGEVDEDEEETEKQKNSGESEGEMDKNPKAEDSQIKLLSQPERESLLRNDLRSAIKPFKGNKLFLRFATQDDKKELGAARRSRYYMKYGNPNYGGMKGILSNSWKRRFHTRRIQRDVIKTDLVNLPEEPIKEEEEEEEEEGEEDMDSDDRVVEYKERGGRSDGQRVAGSGGLRSRLGRSASPSSESDEMDYDLELKMISMPSPKKSMKMTMYADELETNLKSIRNSVRSDSSSASGVRNRIGVVIGSKTTTGNTVTDVRQLLEEKRQGLGQHRQPPDVATSGKTDVRQRLGKRHYSPERQRSKSPVSVRDVPSSRESPRDVHSRLGTTSEDIRGLYSNASKDRKTSRLWSRLGPSDATALDDNEKHDQSSSRGSGLSARLGNGGRSKISKKRRDGKEEDEESEEDEEDDSTLQRVWGAMIKQKQEQLSHRLKKSRLDNLPSLQIEISRDSSNGSDSDS